MQPDCMNSGLYESLNVNTQTHNNLQFYSLQFDLTKPNQPIIQNQSFQDYIILQKWKLSKISPFEKSYHPKVKIIQNQSLQDHYILPNWKLLKISLFRPLHPHKVAIIKKN